jgi:hypothetical protein
MIEKIYTNNVLNDIYPKKSGMKRHFTLALVAIFSLFPASKASDSIFVKDDFTDLSQLKDLSEMVIWGDHKGPVSCFAPGEIIDNNGLSFRSIHVSEQASPYSTYQPLVNGKPSLRTMSCFDYEFPAIERSDKIITIEFDAFWSQYDPGYGEQGRIVVTLVDDYPEGGPRAGDIDSLHLEAPFGRPKYNLRLRNSTPVDPGHAEYIHRSPGFMLYGGGHDIRGEFEKSTDWGYWMPGFSSEAGGGAPGQPSASDFPYTATKKFNQPWSWNSITQWHHYTWVISPELLELYMRPSSADASENQLLTKMAIPKDVSGEDYILDHINEVHETAITEPPLFYKWFGTFNAIRVYFRGFNGNIAYLANLQASYRAIEPPVHVHDHILPTAPVVFPNPSASGIFYFDAPIKNLMVYDLGGRLVFQADDLSAAIDLSHLTGGVYMYKAMDVNNIVFRGKVIRK